MIYYTFYSHRIIGWKDLDVSHTYFPLYQRLRAFTPASDGVSPNFYFSSTDTLSRLCYCKPCCLFSLSIFPNFLRRITGFGMPIALRVGVFRADIDMKKKPKQCLMVYHIQWVYPIESTFFTGFWLWCIWFSCMSEKPWAHFSIPNCI